MKLTYRGVSYEHIPVTLEVNEVDIIGKYRGQAIRRHVLTQELQRPEVESALLHYRGSNYKVMQPVFSSTRKEAPSASCPVRLPQLSKLVNSDIHSVHLNNMRSNLERRLQMARQKGDEQLISQLQQESRKLMISIQH